VPMVSRLPECGVRVYPRPRGGRTAGGDGMKKEAWIAASSGPSPPFGSHASTTAETGSGAWVRRRK
jgi:hypothetical protein